MSPLSKAIGAWANDALKLCGELLPPTCSKPNSFPCVSHVAKQHRIPLHPSRNQTRKSVSPKMALQHLDFAPKAEDFTPLQQHQEQTPSTFFGSKPVLYAQYSDLTLSIPSSKLQADPSIGRFAAEPDEGTEDALIKNVEIWVSSEYVYQRFLRMIVSSMYNSRC